MTPETMVRAPTAREPEVTTAAWIPLSDRMIGEGLTFDDVFLLPAPSKVLPKDTDTSTVLCPGIRLAVPFVSSPMDRVTETKMAVAMALFGGIGIIHRELGRDRLIRAVRAVKRFMAGKIEDPERVSPEMTLGEVRAMRLPYTGFPVTDSTSGRPRLAGIITRRDMDGKSSELAVKEVMTPRERVKTGKLSISFENAFTTMQKAKVEKLPLVDDDDVLVGLVTRRDLDRRRAHPQATIDSQGRLRVGVAVGAKNHEVVIELVRELIAAGADVVCVDSAHGGHIQVVEATRKIKENFLEFPVIAGNVADKASALLLLRAGADALRCGLGSGSICTTRVISGCGVPQITAIGQCREAVEEFGKEIPIISDGGATEPGHTTKALASGASTIMFGNVLAGTDEAPGKRIKTPRGEFKEYRGMGSEAALLEHGGERYFQEGEGKLVPEGVRGRVPYKGPVHDQLMILLGGLQNGMGYAGAAQISDLWRTRMVRVTAAGLREAYPHHLEAIEGQETFKERED